MKSRFYIKIVIGYLFFCLCVFVLLLTFTRTMVRHYLIRVEAENLHNAGSALALQEATSVDFTGMLNDLSLDLSADIWLVDEDGTATVYTQNYLSVGDMLLSTGSNTKQANLAEESDSNTTPASDTEITNMNVADILSTGEGYTTLSLPTFSADDFTESYYQVGNFYGLFPEKYLTVSATCILSDQSTVYLLLHKPMRVLTVVSNSIINIFFYTVAIIFLILFLLLAAFTYFMYQPLYRVIQGTKQYADGHFDYQIHTRSKDEIGYLADTLNYMAQAMRTREEDQRRFIANVSHDFRSPLTSIRGYVDAMLDGTIPPENQQKYLQIIHSETEHLQKLTENILELNRISNQGILLEITEFDVDALIRQVLPTFEGTCAKKGIRLVTQFDAEPLAVRADRDKIAQVLYNLVDNAVKFSSADSEIVLHTSAKGSKVSVSVRDHGIGIPAESIPKIWDRFYKTDLSRGKDRTGSGLGLSIIREIIQAHGEHIHVASTVGEGTEFIFTLPYVKNY